MEFDFSIRCVPLPFSASQSFSAPDTTCCLSEYDGSRKREAPSRKSRPSTYEHVKRLRTELCTGLAEAEERNNPFEHVTPVADTPPVIPTFEQLPRRRADPFKHAGLMREYGGIKAWLDMQRNEFSGR